MKNLLGIVLVFLFLLFPYRVTAGPWTVLEGEVFISFSQFISEFDEFYNIDKEKNSLPDNVVNYDSILDLSYGFYEDWETSVRLTGYKSTRYFPGDEDSQAGFGDGWLKVKHHFFRGPIDAAAQAGFKWAGDYDATLINSPGDGQEDIELRLLLGKLWDRFYLSLESAYRFRFDNTPNEYEVSADMGYALTSFAQLRFFCQMRDAEDGIGSAGTSTVILPETEEDAVTVGGGVTLKPKKDISLTFQYSSVLNGRNTPKQSNFGISLSYSFDYFLY